MATAANGREEKRVEQHETRIPLTPTGLLMEGDYIQPGSPTRLFDSSGAQVRPLFPPLCPCAVGGSGFLLRCGFSCGNSCGSRTQADSVGPKTAYSARNIGIVHETYSIA